tara:strand:+ start:219 stop:428 length:210 start_codon:yes stop_codon:yes gene_type:complete
MAFKKGTGHIRAKLTEDDIHRIRALKKAGTGTREIARGLDVSHHCIHLITTGKTWKHVHMDSTGAEVNE